MGFLYETHSHTCEASACGKVHGEDYISYMMDKGYSGMIITDHFFVCPKIFPGRNGWRCIAPVMREQKKLLRAKILM